MKNKECDACGAELLDHFVFCPVCGKKISANKNEKRLRNGKTAVVSPMFCASIAASGLIQPNDKWYTFFPLLFGAFFIFVIGEVTADMLLEKYKKLWFIMLSQVVCGLIVAFAINIVTSGLFFSVFNGW